jgi:serine/threonine protein kinase
MLVMEYVLMSLRKWNVPETIILDIAHGLQHLYSLDLLMIHRDLKLDIFSFGNIIEIVLTGEFPAAAGYRDERNRRKTEVQHREQLLVKIPESKEKDLIIHCLNNNPDYRPTIDQALNTLKGLPAAEG